MNVGLLVRIILAGNPRHRNEPRPISPLNAQIQIELFASRLPTAIGESESRQILCSLLETGLLLGSDNAITHLDGGSSDGLSIPGLNGDFEFRLVEGSLRRVRGVFPVDARRMRICTCALQASLGR